MAVGNLGWNNFNLSYSTVHLHGVGVILPADGIMADKGHYKCESAKPRYPTTMVTL